MRDKRKASHNMRNKVGAVFMLLGTVLVLAALSLFLWNQRENEAAGESAQKILPQIVEEIRKKAESPEITEEGEEGTESAEIYPDPYDPAMREVEIDGNFYVGYLSIPTLGLDLPVMSGWGYTQLRISPCRYAGSTRTGDLVVCAHNYDRHFGPIRNLVSGDEVYFTDMDGEVWQYAVETVDILAPTDVDGMLAGEYDLTLFTCTYGGQSRVTARCRLEKGGTVIKRAAGWGS